MSKAIPISCLLLAICITVSIGTIAKAQANKPTVDAKSWPRFRGFDGSGITNLTNLPETWNVPQGVNVLWKTPLDIDGNSSPIVVGNRVFLTAANDKHRMVQCFDAALGKLVWQREVPPGPGSNEPIEAIKKMPDTGYAACTMASDGQSVAAMFPNGDLAVYDLAGNLKWTHYFGIPENPYGHAASLAVYNNLLIVPLDQSTVKAAKSLLTAFDFSSGKIAWQQKRPVISSWSTPVIAHTSKGDQLVATANPWAIAYEPLSGKELWKANCMKGDVAPSPVFGGGLLLAPANDYSPLMALHCEGQGDVSKTAVAWKCDENCPDICSPLATETNLYLLTTGGVLTSYDLASGEKAWEEDLNLAKCKSSLSMVGKRLLVIGYDGEEGKETGKCVIVEPGPKGCKRVAENDLGEACTSCPAFVDGRIYIRGRKNLICIGKKE
jgi:outer membrane protein assembly factor BamB